VNGVPVGADRLPARKDDAVHISGGFIRGFRAEYLRVAALQAYLRLLEIEKRNAKAVNTPGCGLANAVVKHRPPFAVSMSGAQSPISLASEHPPRRASSMIR
jgi:hypothetical protein